MRELREVDRQGWIVIGLVGISNVTLLIGGLLGGPASSTLSLLLLAALGFVWAVTLQLTRTLLRDSLEIAQDSTTEWQRENDFARELVDGYMGTIHDLARHDAQRAGIHTERLRTTVVKRYPRLEGQIGMVAHPLNMTGITI